MVLQPITADFDKSVTVWPCVALCDPVLRCVTLCCAVWPCVALCHPVLRCVTLCCVVWPCVALCHPVLRCVTLCCVVSPCVTLCSQPSVSMWMSVLVLLLAGFALASSVRYTLARYGPALVARKVEKATSTNGNAAPLASPVTSQPPPCTRSSSKKRPPSLPPRLTRLSRRNIRTHPRHPTRQLPREKSRPPPFPRWNSNPALSRTPETKLHFEDSVRPRLKPLCRTSADPLRMCCSTNWLSPPNRVGKRIRMETPYESQVTAMERTHRWPLKL